MSLKDFVILAKIGKARLPTQLIGSGSFSEVFKARRVTDGKVYALKKVRPSMLNRDRCT